MIGFYVTKDKNVKRLSQLWGNSVRKFYKTLKLSLFNGIPEWNITEDDTTFTRNISTIQFHRSIQLAVIANNL